MSEQAAHNNPDGVNGATSDFSCTFCGADIDSYRNHLPCPDQPDHD